MDENINNPIQNIEDPWDGHTFEEVEGFIKGEFSAKQDTLVSGETIKTINNIDVLGSGNIVIPKGEDAVNPFKGWFGSSSALSAAYPSPNVGDYAYIKGASASDPAAIYECATAGTWSNSGRTVDTSSVQMFATGEEVNEVGIDESITKNSEYLTKSKNVYEKTHIKSRFNINNTAYLSNGIISQNTGKFSNENNINQYNGKILDIEEFQGKTLRIVSKKGEDSAQCTFALLQSNNLVNGQIPSYATGYTTTINVPFNGYIDVLIPSDANYIWYYTLRGHDITPTLEVRGDVALNEIINTTSKGKVIVIAATAHNKSWNQRFLTCVDVAEGAFIALTNKQSNIFNNVRYWDNFYAIEMPSYNPSMFQQCEYNVLAENNKDVQYINGSTTKVMSLIAGLEYVSDMGTIIEIKSSDIESGSGGLNIVSGDTISLKDLIFGMMVASSNTLAHAFGRFVGSISLTDKGITNPTDAECTNEFLSIMNRKAQLIGMNNSHFTSASGNVLSSEVQHYSTPHDLCIMALIASSINYINDAWAIKDDFSIYFGGANPHTELLSRDLSSFSEELNPENENRLYNILGYKTGSQDYGNNNNNNSYHSIVMVLQNRQ